MAKIFPFRSYRYSARAGDPASLVTQPYDKITPEMQERYFSLSPHNLAHVIRGRTSADDTPDNNVYTRAAGYLRDWIASGLLAQDHVPGLFACFQKFQAPGGGRTLVRKGLIALGAVEDYSQGTVYRHERTHSAPKRDRLELLRHTRAHFGQLFLLYDDPRLALDARLDEAARKDPLTRVTDEYGAEHALWPIRDPAEIAAIQRELEPHKLLIADGHHRYETALAFRNENPGCPGAAKVMMTLVNMQSPGLVILATHRVVGNLPAFDTARLLEKARSHFTVEQHASLQALEARLASAGPYESVLGAAFRGDPRFFAFVCYDPARGLDVALLHEAVLGRMLGLTDEAVRDQKHIRYIRGFQAAAAELASAGSQAVFFLNPVGIEQVAEVAFAGAVMPQKSTDFYPKLLSGLTIYRVE